jgi:hypothetical protein
VIAEQRSAIKSSKLHFTMIIVVLDEVHEAPAQFHGVLKL